jgi:hypothetical protein
MADVRITAGTFAFRARFERDAAPLTCAKFESMLPYRERLIHVRWSGEACWIPLGGLELGLGYDISPYADRLLEGTPWQAMAWRIHDQLPYSQLQFFPRPGAFDIGWQEY